MNPVTTKVLKAVLLCSDQFIFSNITQIVVGDSNVGKTSLIMFFCGRHFPGMSISSQSPPPPHPLLLTANFSDEHILAPLENQTLSRRVEDQDISLNLWDTANIEEYGIYNLFRGWLLLTADRFRHLAYPGTDVFIICFSLINRSSYDNVKMKWYLEINHYLPLCPFIVVGTKKDLREDPFTCIELEEKGLVWYYHSFWITSYHLRPVTMKEGQALANELGASAYLECSALKSENIEEVFHLASVTGMNGLRKPKPERNRCYLS